jgi:hypothetical protein
MTEEAVVLANLLQAIQARVLAEVEDMLGADVSQVSRLLAFSDEEQVATALRGSFLAGTLQPAQFLEMVEMVLVDLDERMPALLDAGTKNDELREMIMEGASADKLRSVARKHGMRPLRDIGMDFLHQGLTTADEVIRETIQDA